MACSQDNSATRTLRVGHQLDTQHPVHLALEFMSADLYQRSNGNMTLAIYPNGQLGSEREMIELLQLGALDMTKVSASPLEGFSPSMGVFSLPYLFRDNTHYWAVLNGAIGQHLLSTLAPKKLIGLGYFDAGSRSFYSKNDVVHSPSNIAGQKVRVMNSKMAIDTMVALGASATPIPGGEVYTALQQGIVDAAENNPPTYYNSRHFEVAPFYSLDEHASIPDVILLSSETRQRLSKTELLWLEQSMNAATTYQVALWNEATDKALQQLQRAGVVIIRPDKSPFITQVNSIYTEYQNTVIGDLVNQIQAVKGEQ